MDLFRRKSNGGMNSLLNSSSSPTADDHSTTNKKSSDSPNASHCFLGSSSSKQSREDTNSSRPSFDDHSSAAAASPTSTPTRSILPSLPPINLSPFSFLSSSSSASPSSHPASSSTFNAHHPTRSQSISFSKSSSNNGPPDAHVYPRGASPMVRSASSPLQAYQIKPTSVPLNDEPSPSPSSFRSTSNTLTPLLDTPASTSSAASSRAIRKAASIESFRYLSVASSPRSSPLSQATPPAKSPKHTVEDELLLDRAPPSGDPSPTSAFAGLGLGAINPSSNWSNRDGSRRIKKSSLGGGVTVSMVAHLKAGGDGLDLDEYDSETESLRAQEEGKRGLLEESEDEEDRVEIIWQQGPKLRQYGDGPGDEDSAESDLSEEEQEFWNDEDDKWGRNGPMDRSDDPDTTPQQIRNTSNGIPRTTSSFNIHPSPPKLYTQPGSTTITPSSSALASIPDSTTSTFPPNVYESPPVASLQELSPFASMLAQSQEEVMREARKTLFAGRTADRSAGTSPTTSNREDTARVVVVGVPQGESEGDGSARVQELGAAGVHKPLAVQDDAQNQSLLSPSKRESHIVPLAVVGHAGVGKTTLIKRAFKGWEVGEPETVPLGSSSDGMTIEIRTARCLLRPNTYGNIRLYEVPLSAIDISNGRIEWPAFVPPPEAVMLCYDAGVKSSLDGIPELLACKDPDLPYLVYALKSAGVPRPVELPAAQVAEKVGKYVCPISVEDDKTTRFMHKGFSFLMREAHNRRYGPSSPSHAAYYTPSSEHSPTPSPRTTPRPPTLRILTASSTDPSPSNHESRHIEDRSPRLSSDSLFSEKSQQRLANEVCWNPSLASGQLAPLDVDEGRGMNGITKGASSRGSQDSEEGAAVMGDRASPEEGGREGLVTGSNEASPSKGFSGWKKRRGSSSPKEQASAGGFFALPDLIGLLFYHLLMGDDPFFEQTFIWTFRRFARPLDLITAIYNELLTLNDKKLGLSGSAAQMKICKLLTDWWHHHRSDFAGSRTKTILLKTHAYIIGQYTLAHYEERFGRFWLQELKSISEPRLPWAISDHAQSPQSSPALESSSQIPSPRPGIQVSVETTQTVSISHSPSTGSLNSIAESPTSTTSVTAPTRSRPPTLLQQSHSNHSLSADNPLPSSPSANNSSRVRHDSDISRRSNSSSPAALSSMDNLTKSSSRTSNTSGTGTSSSPGMSLSIGGAKPASTNGGGGDLWESSGMARMAKRFLETSDRQIAEDITRMEWELFMEVKPRGLMTYVLSNGEDQECSRIAQHFNDISSLFSFLVLSQTKLKTRAKIYERIIRITHLVRSHSNYMSLTSIMASMSEYFIVRLSATQTLAREVLEAEVDSLGRDLRLYSRFQSHEKLVAPKGNYRYYRKAIEADLNNSREIPLIPIFPVVCSDITRVNNIYPDRKDGSSKGNINWTKFEKYGELLHFVQKLQGRGCPVRGSTAPNVVKLMLSDKPPTASDSVLSARSRYLENPEGAEATQKNFSTAFNKLMARARNSRDQ